MSAHRWGCKRHRKRRRERIVANRVRRWVRHAESQYLRSTDNRWHLIACPGGEIVVHDFLTWTVGVDWADLEFHVKGIDHAVVRDVQ